MKIYEAYVVRDTTLNQPDPSASDVLLRSDPSASGVSLCSDEKILAERAPLGLTGPGAITTDGKTWLQVRCGRDAIRIVELQAAGRKRMDIASFLLGFREGEGSKFV